MVDPPVTDVELEQLNTKARGIMYGLSSELQQAQVMLQKPPAVRPPKQTDNPDVYGGSQAPIIPPIVPVPLTASSPSASHRSAKVTKPVQVPTAPTVGPVLGGASTGLVGAPSSGLPVTPPTGPGSPSPGVVLPSSVPPINGVSGRAGVTRSPMGESGAANQSSAAGKNEGPHSTRPTLGRPMPPGGLIGGAPGMALGQPSGTAPARRVNPVGGVIGGGGAGTAPTGAAGSRPRGGRGNQIGGVHGFSPLGGAPGYGSGFSGGVPGRTGRREQADEQSRVWDPDHPWETEEGVNPVVLPPQDEGPIDPGPAIGFNR
ncbi:hypothetical protein HDA35_002715 [Micromonospora purpureochromogenes]|uniref:Uncharacterized protein n=1 Tax=Micromonospora purpureochromogenes TaxID=47872 RepID=A0ABX2RK49_9ACTN|nr:hypothetical protein [Micromonospora purpureochromogenes]